MKIFITSLLWCSLTIASLYGQFSHPISVNGHIDLKFITKQHETIGRINYYRFSLNPSALIYFHRNNPNFYQFKFALGFRTSITMNYYADSSWHQRWNYYGIYPLARFYLPNGTFIEAHAGPRIFALYRYKVGPGTDRVNGKNGRYVVVQVGSGVGHSFKITNKISFEPILIYYTAKVNSKWSLPEGYIPEFENKSGLMFLFGFQFQIYQPKI